MKSLVYKLLGGCQIEEGKFISALLSVEENNNEQPAESDSLNFGSKIKKSFSGFVECESLN
jgi:hypothetical protein